MPIARIHVDTALRADTELNLPANAARHVQVLRLQPGAQLTLFDGMGGEWAAEVLQIGRREVSARVLARRDMERELRCAVTLALGMPANERMDTLVEKATELGVAAIRPLVCERSVLRLAGERAQRKTAHWQAVAVAACEQSGRNRVPGVAPALSLPEWLAAQPALAPHTALPVAPSVAPLLGPSVGLSLAPPPTARLLLSLDPLAVPILRYPNLAAARHVTVLSGPEGGLTAAEQALAMAQGFTPVSLGPRVLRADTAPLAVLACIAALEALA